MSRTSRTAAGIATRRPVHVRNWTVSALLFLGTALFAAGQARADDGDNLKESAVQGQIADVGSTGIGLAMGAAEANPLGLLSLGVKAVAYQQIKEAPEVEQPRMWSAYGAFGWGATANNLCIIAVVATGGAAAAVCPLVGLATGVSNWNGDEERRNRLTFDAICQQARTQNPDLVCTYTPPARS